MSLYRNFLSVGGLTLVSRVFGFVRDALMAAVLGISPVSDAFNAAFRFPNLFRRLFAAFSPKAPSTRPSCRCSPAHWRRKGKKAPASWPAAS
jgi:hypothetical protein